MGQFTEVDVDDALIAIWREQGKPEGFRVYTNPFGSTYLVRKNSTYVLSGGDVFDEEGYVLETLDGFDRDDGFYTGDSARAFAEDVARLVGLLPEDVGDFLLTEQRTNDLTVVVGNRANKSKWAIDLDTDHVGSVWEEDDSGILFLVAKSEKGVLFISLETCAVMRPSGVVLPVHEAELRIVP